MKIRINKFLARSKGCSRRAADQMIQEGRLRIDGMIIKDFSTLLDNNADVRLDHQKISMPTKKIYLAINKPQGYICTNHDPQGRSQIKELLPSSYKSLFSVGRLDIQTEGLLLLTNDGEWANIVSHPNYGVEKSYRLLLNRNLSTRDFQKIIKRQVYLNDGRIHSVKLYNKKKTKTLWDIVIKEGRYRIVRRIFQTLGYQVLSLKRFRIGSIALEKLPSGQYRELSLSQIDSLKNHRPSVEKMVSIS